ncbi:MAG TPA: hypothetical protein VH596_03405 [Terriglobales bacterium]|jgi:hypothetical protein
MNSSFAKGSELELLQAVSRLEQSKSELENRIAGHEHEALQKRLHSQRFLGNTLDPANREIQRQDRIVAEGLVRSAEAAERSAAACRLRLKDVIELRETTSNLLKRFQGNTAAQWNLACPEGHGSKEPPQATEFS